MIERAVDDGRHDGAARAEVPGRQLAGPPRSDQHDALAVEALEDLLREGGRRCRDGRRALADRRLETRATAGVEGHAERPVEQRAGGSRLVGIPHLAEDLSLSGDEGVEPRCDAEQVQRRRLVRQPVRDRCERARVRSRKREERAIRDLACVAVARGDVELRAVAGRQNDRLDLTVAAPRELLRQRPCGLGIDGHALTQLDRRRVMRDACERDLHDAKWVRGRTTPTSVNPTTSDHASRRPWSPISRRRTRAVA